MRNACKCPPLPGNDPRKCLQDLKDSVNSLSTFQQARGNTERMKIPLKQPQNTSSKSTVSRLTNSGDEISQNNNSSKLTNQTANQQEVKPTKEDNSH